MHHFLFKKSYQSFSFLKFSQTLFEIEQTASTIKKVEILSEYLLTLSEKQKEESKKLFDFVNQKIRTGVSDKLLIAKCSKILGENLTDLSAQDQKEQRKVVLKNKETVAIVQKYISKDKASSNIKIEQINQAMSNLNTIEGKNAVEIKINEVISTLSKLSFIESRFFLRILTKDMKIGMKSKLVEKAYMDVKSLQSGSNLELNFKAFNPMLAKPLRDVQEFQKFCDKKEGKIIADVKYDGERTLITFQKGKDLVLISRNGKKQNEKYYKIAQDLRNTFQSHPGLTSITLDAQIMAVDKTTKQPLPFQVLLTRRKGFDIITLETFNDDNVQQIIYAFDVLEYNGEKIYTMPLIQRKQLVFENTFLKKGEYEIFSYPEQKDQLMEYFHRIVARKYQGLILKGLQDHYYTNGSRIHWGKLKKGFRQKKEDKGQIDLDLILMGADYGRGKKVKFFSSFLFGVKHGSKIVPISRVGSGFADQELQSLTKEFQAKIIKSIDPLYDIPKNVRMDVWFKPELVVQIDCQQFTRSPLYELGYKEKYGGISLRFPVFKRLRDDKNIEQATQGSAILQEMDRQESKMQQRSQRKLAGVKKNSLN